MASSIESRWIHFIEFIEVVDENFQQKITDENTYVIGIKKLEPKTAHLVRKKNRTKKMDTYAQGLLAELNALSLGPQHRNEDIARKEFVKFEVNGNEFMVEEPRFKLYLHAVEQKGNWFIERNADGSVTVHQFYRH